MTKKFSPGLVLDGSSETLTDDHFWLYDLKVEVVSGDRPMVCNHQVGGSACVGILETEVSDYQGVSIKDPVQRPANFRYNRN